MAAVIAVALVAVEVQAAPKARAATPSQIHTYNISFQTSGQNMWGPSGQQPGSAPGITIVPSVSWNQSGTAGSESTLCTADLDSDCGSGDVDTPTADLDGDHTVATDSDGDGPSHDCDPAPLIGTCTDKLEVVSDGHMGCPKDLDSDCGVGTDNDVPGAEIDDDTSKGTFGGGVKSLTNGQVGLQLNFGNITGGSVSVSAPEKVQLTVEPPSGQQVTIQTSWSTPSAGSITSHAPVGGISLSGTVGVQGSSGGSACVKSCLGMTILPAHSGFAPQSLDTGAITDTSHIPILSVPFAQKLGAAGCTLKGWSGWLSSPDPTLGATTQGTGGQLSATGSDTFINAQLDMAQWASCLAGNPVPLSLTLPSSALPSNVSASYSLLFAGANPQLSETQDFTFQPQPQVTLTFGATMPYVVHTPGQAAVQGSGASVTMPAGSSVTVTAPWSGLSVTPSFSMSDTFTNKTSFTEDNSWNIKALSTSGSFPGYSSPQACVKLLGKPYCMQGVSIFSGESWNEPPVYSQSYPGATSTQKAYGSGSPLGLSGPNHWDLGGFNTVTESPLAIQVGQAPAVTSASSATFTTGQAGSFKVTTTGLPAPALTESGALPAGVTFKDDGSGTATLAGTPAAGTGGSYALTITAANGVSPAATQSFTLKVDQPPAITSTTTSATFTTGQAGSVTVTTTGFPAPALTESGALPGGVTFKDNGDGTATLTGTPAAGSGGTYPLAITASNGVGSNATQGFKLTVDQPPAITSTTTSATFTTGQAGSVTVTTTGFPTAALTESGALPGGVTFKDDGSGTATLAGTPTAGTGGRYALTITASNGVSPAATQSFTVTVDQPPAITSPARTTFTLGQAGSFTVGTTGFPTASLSDGAATLPGGVTFKDNGDGTATLAGTPAVGTVRVYPITLTATNGVAPNASQSFSFTVVRAPTATTITSTVQGPVVGQPVTYTATVSPAPDGGSLAFSDGGSPVAGCGQIALTAGRGTCNVTYTSPGSHSITAAYSGDPSYVGSTSDPLALAVAKAATRVTLTSQAVPLTICPPGDGHDPACSPDQGQPGPDGNGPGRAGRSPSGPPSRGDLRGNACSYVPGHDQGAGGLLATVSGSVYNAVHIPSGPDISVLCQSVILTATVVVDAPGAGTPTGTVSFSDATTGQSLGTAALSTSGGVTTASLTLDSLPAGPQQIVASYVGDTDFLANSGSLTQRVEYIFAGLLPPLDPSRPVEAGATVPVTFTLLDAHGRAVRDASATLLVNGNPAVPRGRTDVRDRNGNQAVPGDAFRFHGEHYQYDLDLRTQGLTGGTATLTIGVSDGTTYSFTLTIRSRPVPLQQSPGRNQHSPNGDTTPRR